MYQYNLLTATGTPMRDDAPSPGKGKYLRIRWTETKGVRLPQVDLYIDDQRYTGALGRVFHETTERELREAFRAQ